MMPHTLGVNRAVTPHLEELSTTSFEVIPSKEEEEYRICALKPEED